MPQVFFIFAACAFASGFALRVADPLILPIALQFNVAPAAAAMLSAAFALPYAMAQPFLGPLGDRFGKPRCIQVCIAATALALLLGCAAPSFEALLASRVVAGVFAGGLIPLVLAGIGDGYALHERQVTIGRLLLAIITGQMLGSSVAGFVNDAFGWRIALLIAAGVGTAAAGLAWGAMPAEQLVRPAPDSPRVSFTALYGRVFDNPKAKWLYGAVVLEACFVFGAFPHVGLYLIDRAGSTPSAAPSQAGLVLGAFSVGGLAYALSVRRLIAWLGVRRMCVVGSCSAAAAYAALAVLHVWWLAALAMLLAGGCYYMLHNSLQTEATEIAPTARGSAVALFACGFFAGQGFGPVLFGALVHAFGFAVALLSCAVGLIGLGQVVVRRIVVAPRPASA